MRERGKSRENKKVWGTVQTGRVCLYLCLFSFLSLALVLQLNTPARAIPFFPNPPPIPVIFPPPPPVFPNFTCPSCIGLPCTDCSCTTSETPTTIQLIQDEHDDTRQLIVDLFDYHQNDFIFDYLFWPHIPLAMMKMTEQLTLFAEHQIFAIGTLFDAKIQLENQRLMDVLTAKAQRDYQPSVSMCFIGTTVRALADTEGVIKMNARVLNKHFLERQLGTTDTIAAEGEHIDRLARMNQFKALYCDSRENGGELAFLCPGATPLERRNKDIDYLRTFDQPTTLNMDFITSTYNANVAPVDNMPFTTSEDMHFDEEDVMALANNLFAHRVFMRIPESILKIGDNQDNYLDFRSIVAKRSVAINSFNMIAAMRSLGSEEIAPGAISSSQEVWPYMMALMRQFNIPDNEITEIISERPSYDAQMEVMTKRMFQRPQFFVNLYESRPNVARKEAALQAIDLMQDIDILHASLREEMLLSVLLEIEIDRAEEAIGGRLNVLEGGGPTK